MHYSIVELLLSSMSQRSTLLRVPWGYLPYNSPGSYGRRSLYKEGETESGKIEQPASLLYEYLYMHKRVG